MSETKARLAPTWRALAAAQRTALVPYLTAGYPNVPDSLAALRMADAHADIIEVGVPFSDPLADGPTIQRSTYEALRHGMTLPGTLELIGQARLSKPVVLFTYLNPVLRYGVERFLRDAAALGVAGLLLTDLPVGGDAFVEETVERSPLDFIRLVAPTTPVERMAAGLAKASGFVYLIARLGVTGASTSLAADLGESVARVRRATSLPIAVGFGISTPAQARAVAGLADGVVVGSALVDALGREGVAGAERFLAGLRQAIDASAPNAPSAGGRPA